MKETKLVTEWYEEAVRGDRKGFDSLITYFHARLLSYALKICGYSSFAQDALQDAYITAFIHLGELKDPENFNYWIRTIVKRSCWRQIKAVKKDLPLAAKLIDSKIADREFSVEFEKNNLGDFLRQRINLLNETLRIVVILRYFTPYNDYENIAKILAVPAGTVKSRLNEAKKQLKKIWNTGLSEMPYEIRSEAEYWNDFYMDAFQNMQKDVSVKKRFIDHFNEDLYVYFTSGSSGSGRKILEKEFEEDIKYGTSYGPGTAFNLKNLGVVQGQNINSKEYPDRCPPTSTLIFHRKADKTVLLQFHNPYRALSNENRLNTRAL